MGRELTCAKDSTGDGWPALDMSRLAARSMRRVSSATNRPLKCILSESGYQKVCELQGADPRILRPCSTTARRAGDWTWVLKMMLALTSSSFLCAK